MGIPYYFKKIVSNYPKVIQPQIIDAKSVRLFMDYNGVVHHCCNELKSELGGRAIGESFEKLLKERVWEYTMFCIQSLQLPINMVFLAIDGIAPMAKLTQQRKRRFMSLWEKTRVNELLIQRGHHDLMPQWDSNAITPGTRFMNDLASFLQKNIKSLMKDIDIQLCGADMIGEGEHKIMAYMRDFPARPNVANVIYGLDADLIMLSMLHVANYPNQNIFLMREPQFYKKRVQNAPFLYVNISYLMASLQKDLTSLYGWPKDNVKENIQDYITICFLLGNDFIPNLSYMKMGTDALEQACQLYGPHAHLERLLVGIDNGKYQLNTKPFLKLLVSLQDSEQDRMADLHDIYMGQKVIGNNKTTNESPEEVAVREIHYYPQYKENKYEHSNSLKFRESGWRRRYYYYLFSDKDNKIIQSSCQQYIKGVKWCIDYYFNMEYDDDFVYPYMFSPTITDLYNYIIASSDMNPMSNVRKQKITYNAKSSTKELKNKLFAVLPPQSIKTLCPDMIHYTNNISYGLVHYFPYDFKVCTYMKTHGWECIPMIAAGQIISID